MPHLYLYYQGCIELFIMLNYSRNNRPFPTLKNINGSTEKNISIQKNEYDSFNGMQLVYQAAIKRCPIQLFNDNLVVNEMRITSLLMCNFHRRLMRFFMNIAVW